MQKAHFIRNIRHRLNQEVIFEYLIRNMHSHVTLDPTACYILVKTFDRHTCMVNCEHSDTMERCVRDLNQLGLINVDDDGDMYPVCSLTQFGLSYVESAFKHPKLLSTFEHIVNIVIMPLLVLSVGWVCLWFALFSGASGGPTLKSVLVYFFLMVPTLLSNITAVVGLFSLYDRGTQFVFHSHRLSKGFFISFCYQHYISFPDTRNMMSICDYSLFVSRHPIRRFCCKVIKHIV